jgi:hypothetical protein
VGRDVVEFFHELQPWTAMRGIIFEFESFETSKVRDDNESLFHIVFHG